jgi:lipopolysaccharide biosynthesis glycosyltransferase
LSEADRTTADRTIVVAAAVDDFYVTPLLVTLRSACRNLAPGWALEVFILGYQITDESRRRMDTSLEGLPVRVRWRTLDLDAVRPYWPGIHSEGDVTAYYRLFLGEALPATVKRVLFLDADLLVEGDLAGLWKLPFDDHVAQAVPDAYARRLHLARLSRVAFSEGIHFSTDTPYFNAGVILIDLQRWRDENVGRRAVSFLWKYGQQLSGRDQDALNCALLGRWKRLPPRWNLHELPGHPDTWEGGGASVEEIQEALRKPAIIHFIGWKPWSRFWRPPAQRRWWAEARRAGVPAVRRPLPVRLWEGLFWGPHTRLRWHILRRQWTRVPLCVLARPWILLTYPLWRGVRRYS